ncbi:MAG TPA: lysophospholipid acyltransferase family protein [Acidiphilium sp.]|nr:MAG: 1-acyl-sn-glycerol-3-phosphate acyltransferase [Acidiphilium sp. 21-60-14]OYV91190.1 MAG: 1-acyl-sn-glycerol-3-phosphate acyltransferase [Acidiphilium sp. 37-60-79]OZB39868.1 MAG: 1-acyl-sn-glycerol-3-phosphate acyltransferase [Acidiphilium sp. 34-60-192]HQT87074.1 lysophospholipid acyltransferase family protein [Acidiphilium sp.]HQU25286.1 lysophospholipid acyltransferase family protein [Acidiphilium sp.]
MFLIGSTLFNLTLFGGAAIAGLYGHWLRRSAPDRLLGFGQGWARLMLGALRAFCGVGFVLRGRENLPPGGVILAAQHQSAFDTLVWLTLLDRPCYILKQELTRLPIFGSLLLPAGQIALDRAGGSAALRHLVKQVSEALAAGKQIIIFPEGTRVAPGVRGALQPGIVALARATGAAVVPVSTDSGRYWARNAFRKRPGVIDITIHPALPVGLGRQAMLDALAHIYYDTHTK